MTTLMNIKVQDQVMVILCCRKRSDLHVQLPLGLRHPWRRGRADLCLWPDEPPVLRYEGAVLYPSRYGLRCLRRQQQRSLYSDCQRSRWLEMLQCGRSSFDSLSVYPTLVQLVLLTYYYQAIMRESTQLCGRFVNLAIHCMNFIHIHVKFNQ